MHHSLSSEFDCHGHGQALALGRDLGIAGLFFEFDLVFVGVLVCFWAKEFEYPKDPTLSDGDLDRRWTMDTERKKKADHPSITRLFPCSA